MIMRKIIYAIIAVLATTQMAQAQEQGKFRVGLEGGYTMPSGGGGVLLAVEPKLNVADNMNVGIRFESAAMAKNVNVGAASMEASLTASMSYSGTFDYYFNSGSSSFAPFLGGGVGYSSLGSIGFDLDDIEEAEGSAGVEVDGKFGGLVRAGFEAGKFRLAATYNLIGKTELFEGAKIKNSYLGISLGFYLGGGKWKK